MEAFELRFGALKARVDHVAPMVVDLTEEDEEEVVEVPPPVVAAPVPVAVQAVDAFGAGLLCHRDLFLHVFFTFLSNFKTFFLSFHKLTTYEHKTRYKRSSYWYKETSIDYIVHKTDFLKTV